MALHRRGESGNVFFTLFGAIALIGVIGVATTTLMRGPVGTVMNLNQRAKADSQLQIARKLVALNAVNTAGDCETPGDGYVEPAPPDTASAGCAGLLTGGGCIPSTVGAAKTDPWGTMVGYCGWNHGPSTSGNGCSAALLAGDSNALTAPSKVVIAVISAGPDRQFQTTCGDDPAYVTRGGDDIVDEWTMSEAQTLGGGGLWTLVSGNPGAITTSKDVDISNNSTFASGTTATFQGNAAFGAGSQLSLANGGLFNLPTQATMPDSACQGAAATANDGVLRINTATGRIVQICDPTQAAAVKWVDVSGASGSLKIDDLADAVSDFSIGGNLFLGNGAGAVIVSGSAAQNVAVGVGAASALTTGQNNVLLGYNAGDTITTESGNILIGDSTDIVAGQSNRLDIGNLIYGDMTAGTVGIGTATPGSTLDISGTLNASGNAGIGGAAAVTGAVTVGSTLDVTGAATLNSTLSVTGNVSSPGGTVNVASGLTTTGPVNFGGTMAVAGASTINNTLHVTGAGTMDADLAVLGNGIVAGDASGASFRLGPITSGIGLFSDGASGLQLQTNALQRLQITSGGAVGIGVASPSTQLDVGGGIRIGLEAGACGPTLYGTLRYTVATDTIEACSNTNAWVTVGTSSGGGGGTGGFWQAGLPGGSGAIQYGLGNVGVGTLTPLAPLHVTGSFLGEGSYTGTAAVPVSGAGTRMFFDVASGSFRAGSVTGTQWDSGNTGNRSMAFGLDTTASGDNSLALGSYVMAGNGAPGVNGNNSLALGLTGVSTANNAAVTGNGSFGIFMQDQHNRTLAANNTMGLFGGRMVIDPNSQATLMAPNVNTDLNVNGNIGSVNFCDVNGNNCFTAADVTGGTTGAPGGDRQVVYNSGGLLSADAGLAYTSAGALSIGTTPGIGTNAFIFGNPQQFNQFMIRDRASAFSLYGLDTGRLRIDVPGMADIISWNQDSNNYLNFGNNVTLNSGNFDLVFGAGGADRLHILNGGNVGVGSATPATRLDVSGTLRIADGGEACAAGVAGGIRYSGGTLEYCDGAAWQALASSGAGGVTAAGADTQVQFNSGGILGANANFVWDNANGRLGVGTAAPGTQIDVNGSAQIFDQTPVTGVTSLSLLSGAGQSNSKLLDLRRAAGGTTGSIYVYSGASPNFLELIVSSDNVNGMALTTYGPQISSNAKVAFTSGSISADASGSIDTSLARNAPGVLEINDGTAGQYRDIQLRAINPVSGSVGIGTVGPATRLDVAGTIRVADGGEACAAGVAGGIRYSGTSLQYCDGTAWNTLSIASGNPPWNTISNPTGNQALTMAGFTSTFTYNAATGAADLFNLTDTAGNTGTGYMLNLTTGAGSALKPFHVSVNNGTEALTVLANGNTGIGTAGPGELLSLSGGNFLATGTFGSSPAIGVSGAGTRMMWYPRKAAFRAGEASSGEWDDANIGLHSMAFGNGASATADESTAWGEFSSATAPRSTAWGDGTTASGDGGTAWGFFTTASGNASTAWGAPSIASGSVSTAWGSNVTASGYASTAIGQFVQTGNGTPNVNGNNSIAIGLTSVGTANFAQVTGNGSLGIFMQDQHNKALATDNTMGLFGGRLVIDPASQATLLAPNPNTDLNVNGNIGAVNYCDVNGNNCFTTTSVAAAVPGAPPNSIQYNSGGSFGGSASLIWDNASGRLGVGAAVPATRLEVGGTLRVADGGEACAAGTAGGIRYNGGNLQYCNGAAWTTLATSGAVTWDAIGSPAGNQALTMGAFTSTWTWNAATGAGNLFNLTDTAANTGTGYLLNVTTAAGSVLRPFHVSVNGGTEALTVFASGDVGIGTATPGAGLDVALPRTAVAGVAYGLRQQQTLTAAADNDALTALYINPTFADAGHAGVSHNGLIVASGSVGIGTAAPGATLEVRQPAGSFPKFRLTAADITLPDYSSSLSVGDVSTTNAIGQLRTHRGGADNITKGGLLVQGFTGNAINDWEPLYLLGVQGGTAPTAPAVVIAGEKTDGAGNRTGLAAAEIVFDVVNNYGTATPLLRVRGDGNVGVGAATPTRKLQVEGAAADVAYFGSTGGADTNVYIDNPAGGGNAVLAMLRSGTGVYDIYADAGGLGLYSYGTTQTTAYFSSTGSVGIRNTAPGALLDIGAAGATLGTMRLEGNTSGYVQMQPAAAAGSWTLTLPNGPPGVNGYVLSSTTAGVTSWVAAGGVAGPAGSDKQIQFNDGGAMAGNANLTFDKTSTTLAVPIVNATTKITLGLTAGASAPVTTQPVAVVSTQVFAASGTYTAPANLLYAVVEVVGGGGGGGGVSAGNFAGGGAGGGGYARETLSAATIGASQAVTVGAGGTAGAATGTNGGVGGTSQFGAGPLLSATGGTGGTGKTANSLTPGAAGGIGSGGDVNSSGQPGTMGTGAGNQAGTYSGNGGSSVLGAGGLGVASVSAVGANGRAYGGGAAGGTGSAARTGGVGAAGVVIVTEYKY